MSNHGSQQQVVVSSPHSKTSQSQQEQQNQSSQRQLTPTHIAQQILQHLANKNFCFQQQKSESSQQARLKLQYLVSVLRHNVTFNRNNGQLGHTNSVLLSTSSNEDIQLFIPGYMRMRIRNLMHVEISTGEIQVNATISFSIHYGKLPRLLVDYLKQSLVLRFSKKNCILLKQTQEQNLSIKVIQQDNLQLITFLVDLPLTFHFQPYYPMEGWTVDMSIWFSPFQKIKNALTITVQDLVVRYDDMMVEFGNTYSKEEFQEVEDYFKYLKGYNGEIRKLIVKVNLMNLVQPHLALIKKNSNKDSKKGKQQVIQKKYPLSSLIRQKYRQMVRVSGGLSAVDQQKCSIKMEDKSTLSDIRVYQLEQELLKLTKHGSPIRFTYEQQHLLGSYEIVPSQMKVKFSCQKYFIQKQRQKERIKLYQKIHCAKTTPDKLQSNPNEKETKDLAAKMALDKQNARDSLPQMSQIIDSMDIEFQNTTRQILASTPHKPTDVIFDEQKIIQQIAQGIKQIQSGPKTFQFAHFQLSIYKHPFVSLAIVFFPLWIIAVINLIIYFSPRDLSNRIANVATLLISYVAYIPIFRQQVPEYRYLLLSEIFAFLQIICSFLTLVHTLVQEDNGQERINIDSVGPIFWVSFSITVLTFLCVVIGYIVFKCAIQPNYKKKKNTKVPSQALRHIIWNNFECDFAFLKKNNIKLFQQCVSMKDYLQNRSSKSSRKTINQLAMMQKTQSMKELN